MPERSLRTLQRFARLVTEASARAQILPILADAFVDDVGADGVIVVEMPESGAPVVAAGRGLPPELIDWKPEADDLDTELGNLIVAGSRGVFRSSHTHLLMSGGGLFGAVVALFRAAESPLPPSRSALMVALGDLAATAMARAAQYEELHRAHEELRASQEALLRTEKLRALGEMAAGVTHDLKNLLNPLSLHLQIAQRAAANGDGAGVEQSIVEMQRALRRGVETVERLREFSRQAPESKLERLDLNRLAREAVEIAKPRMASKGRMTPISLELGSPPPILGRSGELVSALVNLVVNAIDATPADGKITVRTGKAKGQAWIEVADTGPGMSPEVRARVFEPFFTTKGADGTGLGLAMVYACVQRHGSTITLQSAPGEGTTFHISCPAAPG